MKSLQKSEFELILLFSRLCYFSINPNWSQSKTIAIIDSDLEVLIIDFDSGEPIKGHKGHEKENVNIFRLLNYNHQTSNCLLTENLHTHKVANNCSLISQTKYRLIFSFVECDLL